MSGAAGLLIRRELRGEKGLFFLAAATMAAATAALTLVLSLADLFERARVEQSRVLLGGDASARLAQRDFSAAELDWLKANSAAHSRIRVARMLAIAGERTQLTRLKGVDANYPLFGELRLAGDGDDGGAIAPLSLLAKSRPGEPAPALLGAELSELLDLRVGDIFQVGGLTLRVADFVANEPDPDPRLWVGAPLILVRRELMESGHFTRPGALISRFFRVAIGEAETPEEWMRRLDEAFPDAGWRVRGPENAQASTRRAVGKIRDFLALAALAAILVAGIGCGNSVSAFLRARMRAIAVIKMLGGDSALARRVYLTLSALFAIGGAVVGAAVGAGLLFAVAPALSPYLPWPITPSWSTPVFLRALLTATAITAAFAAPPALRYARVNPLALFAAGGDDDRAPPPDRADRLTAAAAFVFAALVLPLGWDVKAMLVVVVAFAAALYAAALAVGGGAEKLGRRAGGAARLGLLAIARNRRQSAAAVMSFGVGIFVLTAALNAESNFRDRIDNALRQEAPSLYFVGALPGQQAALTEMVEERGGDIRAIPFLRGRVSAIGGVAAATLAANAPPGERWILRGDRYLTWSDGEYIGGSRVVAGEMWDDSIAGLQASFDDEAAAAFGVSLGDKLELNILGEQATAVISSFRAIDWQSFDVNFVIILSGPPFPDVPHAYMGAARLPPEKVAETQLAMGERLPNVTPIATAPLFNAAQNLLARAAALLRATALFLLATGAPMIIATLIENRRRRLQNAAVLRLLGATRQTIFLAGAVEFAVMALLAAVPAAIAGALAGRIIVVNIFELEWRAYWGELALLPVAAVALFLALGAGDILRAARNPPYPLLRND